MKEFSQRPLTAADASAYVALTEVLSRVDGTGYHVAEADYLFHLDNPLRAKTFEDCQGIFDDDRLIAMAWLQRGAAAESAHWMSSDGGVHPDYRGHGIGTRLVRWQTDLAPRIHEHYFPGRPLELTARLTGTNTAAHELFAHEGFAPIRWSFRMRRPADAPELDAALPEGLKLETYTPEAAEELRLAHNEAFRDHFRGMPWPKDAWMAWISQDKIEHDLSVLLRDADGTIAGFVVCSHYADPAEDAPDARGLHLNIFGTRRAYRRRGVASGLIAHIARVAREKGYRTQSLGVDAENPTGALGVYERCGFTVERRAVLYKKVFEV